MDSASLAHAITNISTSQVLEAFHTEGKCSVNGAMRMARQEPDCMSLATRYCVLHLMKCGGLCQALKMIHVSAPGHRLDASAESARRLPLAAALAPRLQARARKSAFA